MEINRRLAEIDEKISHIHTLIKQADDRSFALELVIGWLLSHHPNDETFLFLATQANSMEKNARDKIRHREVVAVLDELRAHVSAWHALNVSDQYTQPEKHD